jgi:hypothetical protein
MIEIPVQTDNHYRHAYPMTSEGKNLCRLAGKKTVTDEMVRNLFKMGYKVVDKTPRVEFNYHTGARN